jgi:peptidoglycan-N-acetylglucosamine deacetylase
VKAAGTAVAAAATAGVGLYGGQVPTSQLFGRTIHRRPDAGPRIALTYDDGPNPRATPALLALLERHGARATFFLIGRWARREPGLVRELVAAGHAIGDHTWSHPTLALRSGAQVRDELARCREAVEDAGVTFSRVDGRMLMRPPWGRRRPGTLRAVAAAGFAPVLWSVTGWDWLEHTTADAIGRRCGRARGGDVVLLHDGSHLEPDADRSRSLRATEQVLVRLGADGHRFVTVPELMAA